VIGFAGRKTKIIIMAFMNTNTFTVTLTLDLTVTVPSDILDAHSIAQYAAYEHAYAVIKNALPNADLHDVSDVFDAVSPA
jgi:hypothetical protein